MNAQGTFTIRSVRPAERDVALAELLADVPENDRRRRLAVTRAEIEAHDPLWSGLMVAERADERIGVVLAMPQPGKTALVWPPQVRGETHTEVARALLAATTERLEAAGVLVAQALLESKPGRVAELFRAAGFTLESMLLYMAASSDQFPQARPGNLPAARGLAYEAYSSEDPDRMARVVEATYHGTLDCPGLNQVRAVEDVLAGYRAVGRFDAQRWLVVVHEGQDVGCLLLSEHPGTGRWELVYMGLVPAARGKGWGLEIVRHGQWFARQSGCEQMLLAVDANNQPAIDMYAQAGFKLWEQRLALLRVF